MNGGSNGSQDSKEDPRPWRERQPTEVLKQTALIALLGVSTSTGGGEVVTFTEEALREHIRAVVKQLQEKDAVIFFYEEIINKQLKEIESLQKKTNCT